MQHLAELHPELGVSLGVGVLRSLGVGVLRSVGVGVLRSVGVGVGFGDGKCITFSSIYEQRIPPFYTSFDHRLHLFRIILSQIVRFTRVG